MTFDMVAIIILGVYLIVSEICDVIVAFKEIDKNK